jgi:hypothetical protein
MRATIPTDTGDLRGNAMALCDFPGEFAAFAAVFESDAAIS